jgi:DNA polymerase V
MVSRSFQSPVYELDDISKALADYTQEAVKRMREENLSCRYITVFLMTNAYAEGQQYFNQTSAQLPYLSAYLPEITATANELLKRLFRPEYKYRKVMITLSGLEHDTNQQQDLFLTENNKGKENEPLMKAFDKINDRYGRGTIKLGCGLGKKPDDTEPAPWQLRREFLSPSYTTKISEIPLVY